VKTFSENLNPLYALVPGFLLRSLGLYAHDELDLHSIHRGGHQVFQDLPSHQ
jgi:hypothetical protein